MFFVQTARAALYQAHEEKAFLSWMRESNNLFVGDEYKLRLGIFMNNKRLVSDFNKGDHSFKVGINKFSACTPAEYQALLGHRSSGPINGVAKVSKANAPESFDWREQKNIVNPIKDQASCGSCWAFSIIQAQESQWALKKKELPSLSEQNIVDCVTSCYGCNGGDEYLAYDYVIKYQKGLFMTEEDYPYTARDGKCKFDASKGLCPVVSYFRPTTTENEEDLKKACYESGVVSIAIDASGWDFSSYTSGIYDGSSCSKYRLNHAVGLVGYGAEGGVDYWIVRNSWGTSWGEQGYIRMIRNKNNHCGVASDVIIPQVE